MRFTPRYLMRFSVRNNIYNYITTYRFFQFFAQSEICSTLPDVSKLFPFLLFNFWKHWAICRIILFCIKSCEFMLTVYYRTIYYIWILRTFFISRLSASFFLHNFVFWHSFFSFSCYFLLSPWKTFFFSPLILITSHLFSLFLISFKHLLSPYLSPFPISNLRPKFHTCPISLIYLCVILFYHIFYIIQGES